MAQPAKSFPVDIALRGVEAGEFAGRARRLEELGFAGAFATESVGDPYISLALASQDTESIRLGTGIALAFTRSPTSVAYSAWDIQRLSGGRLTLGLGSQIRAHIERRYGMPWISPAARMAEFAEALRAIWSAWQTGEELIYEGEHFHLNLMPPNFRPVPIDGPAPRIAMAGVRPLMLKTVARVADEVLLHAFSTPEHLRENVMPALEEGLREGGRERTDLTINVASFLAADDQQWEAARRRVAFYGSTPGYRWVLETHGEGELGERLHELSRAGEWEQMSGLVSDELLGRFCVRIDDPDDAARELRDRYGEAADRFSFNGGADADETAFAPLAYALGS